MSGTVLKRNNSSDSQNTERSEAEISNRKLFAIARVILLAILVLALVFWSFEWLKGSFLYVHETDSRVMADLVAISSEVDGIITQRIVSEGSIISKGDLLVRIDTTVAELKLKQIMAERETKAAELKSSIAEYNMSKGQINTKIASQKAKLVEAHANQRIFIHDVAFLEKELGRINTLLQTGVAARSQVDRIEVNFLKAKQQLIAADTSVSAAVASVNEALANRALLTVKKSENQALEAKLAEIDAKLNMEREMIKRFNVISSMDGIVGRTLVNEGEIVSKGQRLLVLHDPNKIWIETNIRETEINRLSLGQGVKIEVDAYPDEKFSGKISRIGNAATSQFALLPKLNEAGNFTKVTQRIRVQIEVAQQKHLLRPGMMVEVFIKETDSSILGKFLH